MHVRTISSGFLSLIHRACVSIVDDSKQVCILITECECCYLQTEFGGFCPLYGTVNCSNEALNETSVILCSFVAGRSSVCSFVTMSNVLACVLYALGCFGYLAHLVNRSRVMIRVAYVIVCLHLLLPVSAAASFIEQCFLGHWFTL